MELPIGSITTNTDGIATLPYTITQNSGSYTINAQFLQDNVYAEAINSSLLTVDNTVPIISITTPGGLYNTTKTVLLKLSKSGIIYYTLDGTTPTTSSTKYNSSIVIASNKVLKYFAVDLAGNKSPVYSQTYTIDKVAPKVSSTSPANLKTGVSRTSTITIKLSENFKASTYYKNITVKNITTNKYVNITVSIIGNVLYIKTSLNRLAHDWYQITIPKSAIKDLAGNNLLNTYTFKFKSI